MYPLKFGLYMLLFFYVLLFSERFLLGVCAATLRSGWREQHFGERVPHSYTLSSCPGSSARWGVRAGVSDARPGAGRQGCGRSLPAI
eukprot:9458817-Alexandrium_andersonii.AAC.1